MSYKWDIEYDNFRQTVFKMTDKGLFDMMEEIYQEERLNNPEFNSLEFEGIMKQSGLNRFSLSVKEWNQKVNGIGLRARAGIFGWTYAHVDIALEFASWVSPEFKWLWISYEYEPPKDWEYLVLWEYWISTMLYTKWYWYGWDWDVGDIVYWKKISWLPKDSKFRGSLTK